MYRIALITLFLIIGFAGCKNAQPASNIVSGGSFGVRFNYADTRLEGPFCQIKFDDQTVRNSAIVFWEKDGPDSGITVDHAGNSTLTVGGTVTIMPGRPLVFVLNDGTTIQTDRNMPEHLDANDDTAAWITKVLESIDDPKLQEIFRRCNR